MNQIPLFKVFMAKEVDERVLKVLHSGFVGEGEDVKEFEERLGLYIGNPRILTLNSCTSAIMMALRLAGVGQGDLVISTPMTCLATNEAILSLGASPLWADINPFDGNMRVESVRSLVTDRETPIEKVKAILCVHWGGYPCDLTGLNIIARDFGIPVVEDAAQALGATYRNEMVGSYSEYVCFSFQAIKYLNTCDGGAIAFREEKQKERGRLMRWFGLDRNKGSSMRCLQEPPEWGWKMQMTNLAAAIGIENLKWLDWILGKVEENVKFYRSELEGVENVKLMEYEADRKSTNWLFTIKVEEPERFIKYACSRGVECSQAHGRNDTKKIFESSKRPLPGVDEFFSHQVCIPVGWWVGEKERDYVVKVIKEF